MFVLRRERRITSLLFLFSFVWLIWAGRLGYLQLVQGKQLARQAVNLRSQTVILEEYPRGDILDRQGRSLTDVSEQPGVVVFPSLMSDINETVTSLEKVLDLPPDKLSCLAELPARSGGQRVNTAPFVLKTRLSREELERVKALHLSGVYVLPLKMRYGPHSLATHLVGHVGQITPQQWAVLDQTGKPRAYRLGDTIGQKGIESIYESELRGVDDAASVAALVDATGQPIAGLNLRAKTESPREGTRHHVVLTLDRDVQTIVEKVMDERVPCGAVVVLDIDTRDVLAMASRPNFNQNEVAKYLREEGASEFRNRALNLYYPGSIFKLVVAAAALEEGITKLDEHFYCSGKYCFNEKLAIPCLKRTGHGNLTLLEAMAVSCNPVFIELGLRLGRDRLLAFAEKFGLGQDVLLGYPLAQGEHFEIGPHEPGRLGNASIGQEGVRLTPLQVASLLATVADGGTYAPPRVVKAVLDSHGQTVSKYPSASKERVISPATARQLQVMLEAVTKWGTGQAAWVPGGCAGKTSSAQSGRKNPTGREITDAWFAGYAPLDQPRWVVAVLVEGGSTGGKSAAPVFREIVRQMRQLPLSEDNGNRP
ncbi:MAG: penicillin-binding protein 2 [Firmicutes bacterium]|nr:penicillin-binding protein 2 [Bacillota bacterium]